MVDGGVEKRTPDSVTAMLRLDVESPDPRLVTLFLLGRTDQPDHPDEHVGLFAAEDRLLLTDYPNDWRHYNIVEPVFQMKNWTPREAYESLLSAYSEVSSLRSSLKRASCPSIAAISPMSSSDAGRS